MAHFSWVIIELTLAVFKGLHFLSKVLPLLSPLGAGSQPQGSLAMASASEKPPAHQRQGGEA